MLRVRLMNDQSAECPADADGTWKLYSFNRRHSTFSEPSELGLGNLGADGTPVVHDPDLREKLNTGLAFWLSYFEHGSCLWFLRGDLPPPGVEFQWDGRRLAGLLVWEHAESEIGAKTQEDRREDARVFLKEYTAWCNGDVFCYTIEDESGSLVDGCGGFTSAEDLCDSAVPFLAGREFAVTEDDIGLADLLRDRVHASEEESGIPGDVPPGRE